MSFDAKSAAIGGGAAAILVAGLMLAFSGRTQPSALYGPQPEPGRAGASAVSVAPRGEAVVLTATQMQHVQVAPVEEHELANQREAIGNIDFN